MFAKKNVVALAAMLVAATAAQAQVKLYGYLEADVGSYQGFSFSDLGTLEKGKSVSKVQGGDMMTSFIGIAGSEQLTPGLKAEFALETFIANDTGANIPNIAGGFWGRTSWVGLSGDFGKVALGQYDNAFFIMGLSYNAFGSSMTFSPTMVSYYSFADFQGASLGFDTGWVNSITYESPVIAGGFSATLQYSPKEQKSGDYTTVGGDFVRGTANKDNYSISGSYNAGPISAMVVYTNTGANLIGNKAFFNRQKNFGVGGSYDFGVVKAFGQYSQIKSYDDATGTEFGKAKFFQVGASVPVTASGTVMLSYGETKYDYEAVNTDDKLQQYSIGYDHALSKRTSVFGAYTNVSFDAKGSQGNDLGSASTFAVGVKHNF